MTAATSSPSAFPTKNISPPPPRIDYSVAISPPSSSPANKIAVTALASSLDQLGQSSSLAEKNVKVAEKRVETSVLAFLCDINGPDNNGAIYTFFENCMELKVPMVVTRSLLIQSDLDCKRFPNAKIGTHLAKESALWDIYLQKEGSCHGEMVLFLPKDYASAFQGDARLKALGFNPKNLEAISHDKVATGPERKVFLNDFFSIFRDETAEDPLPQTFFFLDGHGGNYSTGGLHSTNYERFLNFLQNRKALALAISSCHAGGPISLVHTKKNSSNKPRSLSFPVFLHSVGNFTTTSLGVRQLMGVGYFEQLTQTIIKKGGTHRSQLQKTLRGLWREVNKDAHLNKQAWLVKQPDPKELMLALPPYQNGSPVGFRPIGEDDRGFAITYTSHRRHQLPNFFKKENSAPIFTLERPKLPSLGPLIVKNHELLQIYPLYVSTPIIIESEHPALLSMIPGIAHHLLSKINYIQDQKKTSTSKTIALYPEDSQTAAKAFFIGEVNAPNEQCFYCVLYFSSSRIFRLHKIQEIDAKQLLTVKYCYLETRPQIKKMTISVDLFALEVLKTVLITTSSKDAIQSASGGQEDEQYFQQALFNTCFWNENNPMPPLLNAFLDKMEIQKNAQGILSEPFQELIVAATPEEKLALLSLAIITKRTALALFIISQPDLDVSGKTLDGTPPLCLVAASKNRAVAKALLASGADINGTNAEGWTPLGLACYHNNLKMVKLLIDLPNLNLEAQDKTFQWRAITYAKHPIILNLLVMKKAQVNISSKSGMTLLGLAVSTSDITRIDRLVTAGSDVNMGQCSPLNEAISTRNPQVVAHLLQNKADPNQADGAGNFPMAEAIKRGTPNILRLLIKHGGQANTKTLMTALVRGCDKILNILLGLDPNLLTNNKITINELIDILEAKEYQAVKKIFTLNLFSLEKCNLNLEFDKIIFAVLDADDEALLRMFLKLVHDIADVHQKNKAFEALDKFFSISQIEKFHGIITDYFPNSSNTWLEKALYIKHDPKFTLAKRLLRAGVSVQVQACNSFEKMLEIVVNSNDDELFELFLKALSNIPPSAKKNDIIKKIGSFLVKHKSEKHYDKFIQHLPELQLTEAPPPFFYMLLPE